MSGRSGSSFGTLLFSVPLAAIPLMAIFGIPQFGSLVASPERTGGYERARDPDDRQRGDRSSGRRRARDTWDDGDFDQDADRESLAGDASVRLGNTDGGSDHHDGWSHDPQNRAGARRDAGSDPSPGAEGVQDAPLFGSQADGSEFRSSGGARASEPTRVGNGLTWKSAAQQFHDLGITSYHLESGSEVGSFLFVCSFCPEATPNVTMRFESEATEPLDAVDDVLAQIDRWQQRTTGPAR